MEPTEVTELDETLKNIEELIAEQHRHIELNDKIEQLKKNKNFKTIIEEVFLKQGKEYLWENIKSHEEMELLDKGSTREGNIAMFKKELQARLIFERFLNSFAGDAEHARETIEEAEAYRHKLLNPQEGEQ